MKRFLSDGFNMVVVKRFSHEKPSPTNVVMHINTVILPGNFSFGLIKFLNLSKTFFIQRFLTFSYFFIKTRLLTFFILGVNVFFTSMRQTASLCIVMQVSSCNLIKACLYVSLSVRLWDQNIRYQSQSKPGNLPRKVSK